MTRHTLIGLALALSSGLAIAQLPSDEALTKAQQAAVKASQKALESAGSGRTVVPQMPRFATPTPSGVDPEQVMKQYQAIQKGAGDSDTNPADKGFIVFVSLSMPRATLDRLIDQSMRMKFTLVLRGLQGDSLKATIAQIQTIIGNRDADIQIDPRLFDRFAITRVPAVALMSAETGKSGVVYGDVSVDYALEHMAHAMPGVAAYATQLLQGIRR